MNKALKGVESEWVVEMMVMGVGLWQAGKALEGDGRRALGIDSLGSFDRKPAG